MADYVEDLCLEEEDERSSTRVVVVEFVVYFILLNRLPKSPLHKTGTTRKLSQRHYCWFSNKVAQPPMSRSLFCGIMLLPHSEW